MASQAKKRLSLVSVNGQSIEAGPGETVLAAALRSGVDFPYSCRVGGCGACKCKLTGGKVDELTETGYLLTAQELEQGYVLACQSVPRGDVQIDVDLSTRPARMGGRVVAQERVTHDITRLTVQLDQPIAYKAGQYANLRLEGPVAASRSYSFATPASDDGKVSFFVRKVPGGKLSSYINDEALVGKWAQIEGPSGDFYLREGEGPLLLVAGGSGLAPLLAVLAEAVARGLRRPITLLFGARQQRDLYAQGEIEALERAYGGPFRFVPVLSEEPGGSSWKGERGLVTDLLSSHVAPGVEAYLCGPPAMVDAAASKLSSLGVPRARIFADRFTTQADALALPPVAEEASSGLASALHYLKYFLFHVVGIAAALAIVAGGPYVTLGLLGVLAVYIIGDAISGDDTSTPTYRHPGLLTAQLWLALPLLALIVFASVWSVCSGDPLGFGALLTRLSGYDVIAARDATSFGHHVSTFVLTGLMIGMVGTITAHELTHRTWDKISMLVGRWLLAFSFDTSFAIEHVYGHHRYVSTVEDPATAPRGRSVYAHVVISTIRGNISAWKIEAARLAKKKLGLFSWHNAFLKGHLMSALLVAGAYAMGGLTAALFFSACALWGKALLEIVNYMEHYGMVRDPATPVQPRHSWNTNRRISSWTMFNLTRHSHHHAQGEVPYHELRPYPDAPMMLNGYLTTIVIAMIPPLWHHLMTPKVLAWDRDFATPEERRLAARANAESGNPEMLRQVRQA